MTDQRIENPGDSSSIVRLLTVATVATILGVSPKTIHKLVRERKFPCVEASGYDRTSTGENVAN